MEKIKGTKVIFSIPVPLLAEVESFRNRPEQKQTRSEFLRNAIRLYLKDQGVAISE